ncbi:MAG: effector binding domain-containing protein [Oscillospiraceae bacterium]|nr:effector binding domain-containing protein [Oscillospiraceae bacterium]
MSDLVPITVISKTYGVSSRMLRYYEQIGLLQSARVDGYSYRVYDEAAARRLQQILVLRKLRIPVRDIKAIFSSSGNAAALAVFQESICKLDGEINALSTIRDILRRLVETLQDQTCAPLKLDRLLSDQFLVRILKTLRLPQNTIQEENSMAKLSKADEQLSKLTDRDVRIVYLPPAKVAAIHSVGSEPGPEFMTGKLLFDFVKSSNLPVVMPGFRHYGFNNPDEPVHGDGHGYERWVTIPEYWEVPEPFSKKTFLGGLYAAHMIPMGAWDEWVWLHDWVRDSERYDFRWGTIGDRVCGWLEEHLDAQHHYLWPDEEMDQRMQLDLLIPIQEKKQ